MESIQKHIINKLHIDVQTSDSVSAFDLKDNIDGFLKQDILPFLENYFSTFENDLHSQVIQIPYLSVDVNTSTALNYKELREDVKRAIGKELKRVTSEAHPNNEEAKIIASESSKENTLLHFLETGSSPWWMKSEEVFELSEEQLEELLESKRFLMKLQSKLINTNFRKRIIQQLSNEQICNVLKAIDADRFEKIRPQKFHTSFEKLHSTDRKIIWDCIIDDVLQKDAELFVSRLIFQLIGKLSKIDIEKKVMDEGSKVFIEVIVDILSTSINTPQSNKALKILHSNQSLKKELGNQIEDILKAISVEDRNESPASHVHKTDAIVVDEQRVKPVESIEDSNQASEETTKEQIAKPEDSSQTVLENENKAISPESIAEKTEDSGSIVHKPKKESDVESSQNQSFLKTQKSLNQLIKKEDHALFQELKNMDEQKTYRFNDEVQVNNAGLILLHPYLHPFFQNCELVDENNNITNKDLAVHLLHYMATKQEQQFENNMLFEKILCGVPIEQPIQRTIPISDELKANAEELLEAVLENWGALKNASPDLLRGEFFQRLGIISFKEENPKMRVERKVYDILLDKLPWNIGVCRLPWLDHLLFTDW